MRGGIRSLNPCSSRSGAELSSTGRSAWGALAALATLARRFLSSTACVCLLC